MADKQYQTSSAAWLSVVGADQPEQVASKAVPLLRGNSVATLNQIYQHQNSIPVRSRLLNTAKSLQQSSTEQLEVESIGELQPGCPQPVSPLFTGLQIKPSSPVPTDRSQSSFGPQSAPPLPSAISPALLVQVINVGQRHRKNGPAGAGRQVQLQPGQAARPSSANRPPKASWAWSSDSSSCSSSHGVSPIRNPSPIHPPQGVNQLSSSSSSSQSQLASLRRSPRAAGGSSAALEVLLQHSRSPSPSRSPIASLSASQIASLSPRQRRLLPDIGLAAQTNLKQGTQEAPVASSRFSSSSSSQMVTTPASASQAVLSVADSKQEEPSVMRVHQRQRKLPQIPLAIQTQAGSAAPTTHPILPQRQTKMQVEGVIAAPLTARKNKSLSSSSSASSNSFSAGSSLQQLSQNPTNSRSAVGQLHQQHLANQQLRVQSFPMPAASQPPSLPPNKSSLTDEKQGLNCLYSSSCSNSIETPSPRSPLIRQTAGIPLTTQQQLIKGARPLSNAVGSSSSSSGGASTPATANRSPPSSVLNAVQSMTSPYRSYFTFDQPPPPLQASNAPTCVSLTSSSASRQGSRTLLGQSEEPTRSDPQQQHQPRTSSANVEQGAVRGRRLSTCGSGLRANFLMNKQHAISEFTPPRSLESSASRSSTDWLPVGTSPADLQQPPSSAGPPSLAMNLQLCSQTKTSSSGTPLLDNCTTANSMNQSSSSSSSAVLASAQPLRDQFCLRTDQAPYLSVSHQLLTQRRQSSTGSMLGLPPRAASATETSSNPDGQQQSGLTNIKLNPTALVGVRASFSQPADRAGQTASSRLAPGIGITNALSIDVYQGNEQPSQQHQYSVNQLAAPNPNLALPHQRQSLALPTRDRQPSNVSTVSMPAGNLVSATADLAAELLSDQAGGDQARRRFGAWAERIGGSSEPQRRTCSAGRWRRAETGSSDDDSYSDTASHEGDSGSTGSANSVSPPSSVSPCSSPVSGRATAAADQLTLDDRLRLAERSANELFRKVEVGSSRPPSGSSAVRIRKQRIQAPDYPQLAGGLSNEAFTRSNTDSSKGKSGAARRTVASGSGSNTNSNAAGGDLASFQANALIWPDGTEPGAGEPTRQRTVARHNHPAAAGEQVERRRPGERASHTDVNDDEDDDDEYSDDDDDEQGDDLSLFLRSVDKQRLRQLKLAQHGAQSSSPSNNKDIADHQGKYCGSATGSTGAGPASNGAGCRAGHRVQPSPSGASRRVAVRALKRAVTLRALVKTFGRRSSSCDSPSTATQYLGAFTSGRESGQPRVPAEPATAPRSVENLLVPPDTPSSSRRPASAAGSTHLRSSSSVRRRAAQLFRRAKSSVGQKSSSSELAYECTTSSQLELTCHNRMATPSTATAAAAAATDYATGNQLKRANKLANVAAAASSIHDPVEPSLSRVSRTDRAKGLSRMRSGK